MKQLTDEIRLQIFQQNIGARVKIHISDIGGKIIGVNWTLISVVRDGTNLPVDYVARELIFLKRPLSSITDEELEQVGLIMGFSKIDNTFQEINHWLISCFEKDKYLSVAYIIHLYQYLHSRGFALPFLDWSVEELIKENVYKII